ncbi:MAG: hypothetical protein L6R41_007664 [Letrouitia leprolyta]|nr:MAG: hypothetical protein L6R41_007664 [Letrouitia leprolyta]
MDPTQLPPGMSLSQLPAGLSPNGTLPDFNSKSALKAPIVTVNAAFLAVATLTVGLRLNTRKLDINQEVF